MENLALRKRLVDKNGCQPLFIRRSNVPAGFFLSVGLCQNCAYFSLQSSNGND